MCNNQFVNSILKYLNTWVLEYLSTWVLEYLNTWILEYLNTQILEYLTWDFIGSIIFVNFSNKGICLLYILFYSSVQIKGSKEFNFACFGKYHKLLVSFLSQSDVNVENNTILDTEGPWGINTMILQHCSNILFQQR